jgi:hypothetical protein
MVLKEKAIADNTLYICSLENFQYIRAIVLTGHNNNQIKLIIAGDHIEFEYGDYPGSLFTGKEIHETVVSGLEQFEGFLKEKAETIDPFVALAYWFYIIHKKESAKAKMEDPLGPSREWDAVCSLKKASASVKKFLEKSGNSLAGELDRISIAEFIDDLEEF